jgi:hypothetical protein
MSLLKQAGTKYAVQNSIGVPARPEYYNLQWIRLSVTAVCVIAVTIGKTSLTQILRPGHIFSYT